MKSKILKIFIVITLSLGVFYGIAKILALNTNKQVIESYLAEKTGAEIDIRGKITFKILPLPHIQITHIRIENLHKGMMNISIRAPEADMYPDLLSFLSSKPKANQLHFVNSQLNIELVGLNESVKEQAPAISDNISFIDSTLIITNAKYNLEKKFKNLTLNIAQEKNDFTIIGNFESSLNKYKINSNFNTDDNDKLQVTSLLTSGTNIFNFNGYLDKENLEFYGDSKITGQNLQEFFFKYIYRSGVFFPDGRNINYSLDFDIKLNSQGIESQNLLIASPSFNGKGNFNLGNDGMGALNLDILDIQIDDLISAEDNTRITQELLKLGLDDQLYLQMPSSGLFEVNVNAKNLNIYRHSLSDCTARLILDGTTQEQKFIVDFIHSKTNHVKIAGDLLHDHNNNIGIKGDLLSNGNDVISLAQSFNLDINFLNKNKMTEYTLSSKFEFAEKIYKLTNIDAKLDESIITGEININNNSDHKNSELNLLFDHINFDNYLLVDFDGNTRNIFDYAFGSLSKDSDNRSLFQKFLWLRNINSKIKYRIDVASFVSNEIPDNNLSLKGSIDHRYFAIDNLGIESTKNSFFTRFILDINDINPRVDFYLDATLINADFLSYSTKDNNWSTAYFRIPDFSNLPSSVNADIKHLIYKDLDLSNVKISTKVIDNVLHLDKFHGNIYDNGNFNIAGNYIITGVPTLNIAFTFTDLKLHKFSKFLFNNSSFQSIVNATGTINSFGQNINMFMNRARSDIRMISRPVTLSNYNIKNVIQYIANLSNLEEGLDEYNMEKLLQNGDITFSPIDLKLKIRKGIFKIDNLTLNTESVKSIYSGLINLHEQKMVLNNVNIFRSFYRSGEEVKEQILRFDKKYNGNLFVPEYQLDDLQVKNFVLNIKKHVNELFDNRDELIKAQKNIRGN